VLFRVLDFLPGPVQPKKWPDAYQVMAGVQGSLPNRDWTWEAYVSTVKPAHEHQRQLASLQRYQSLVAQPNFGVGTSWPDETTSRAAPPVCRSSGPGSIENCLDSIDMHGRTQSDLSQDIVEANLQARSRT